MYLPDRSQMYTLYVIEITTKFSVMCLCYAKLRLTTFY